MLQRIGNRPPTPLKPSPNDHAIFHKDGKIKEQYHKLLQEINITLEELLPRTLESFNEPDVPRNVQILRYNHFENKRRAKLEALRTLARQRNMLSNTNARVVTKLGPNSPRNRLLSFGNESFSNVDKDSHRMVRIPTRETNFNHSKLMPAYGDMYSDQKHRAEHRMSVESSLNIPKGFWSKMSERGMEVNNEKETETAMDAVENIVAEELEEKFKRYLSQKKLENERRLNASMIVTKKEEEYREQMKKLYEEKLENWKKKKEAGSKKKKQKENYDEYVKERIERQREIQQENQKLLYEKVRSRMEKSEQQKKRETEEKVAKLIQLNNTSYQRYSSCMERKEIEASVFVESTLQDIQNKFKVTEARKKRIMQERVEEASKHFSLIEEKRNKVKEEKDEQAKAQLEKLLSKMEKERCKSAMVFKRKSDKGPRPIEDSQEFMYRMEEKNLRDSMTEKQRQEMLKQKEEKIATTMQRRRTEWSDLIAERKELWNQRMENISENKGIVNDANAKYLEQRMKNYREKVEQIQKVKEIRKKQLAKVNRSLEARHFASKE